MIYRLRLPSALYRLAVARAGSPDALADLVRRYLTQYAAGDTAQQRGGTARAARLSPEQRSAIARRAALARHHPTSGE